ncbi:MAG: RidA family protein [Lachnospiraceae bacterium]|nr:RidA family protein [Lachnospiraceae bacterium]
MKEVVSTSKAPAAIGPYSQAIKTGGLIFVSGQLPIDESGNLSTGTITEQTKIVMNNVSEILKAAGSGLDKIVKTTILLTDLGVFGEVNEAYGEFFTNEPPARACFQVAALPKNAQIEIEVIAAI